MWERRRRKSSPVPEGERSRERDSSATESSSFAKKSRLRRPWSPTRGNSNQQLPTFSSPASATCSNFLLGGQYIPGKDKTKRQVRSRRLWYRVFCSSPGRMACSVLVLTYVLLWHVLVPITDKLLEYGKTLAGDGSSGRWRSGISKSTEALKKIPGLENLRSIEESKLFYKGVEEEREKLLHGPENRMKLRLKQYEKIVPEWYRHYILNDGNDTEKENVFDEDPAVKEGKKEAKHRRKKEKPVEGDASLTKTDKDQGARKDPLKTRKMGEAVHRKERMERGKKQINVKKSPAGGTDPDTEKAAAVAKKPEKEDIISTEEEHHDPPPSLNSASEKDTDADGRAAHRDLPPTVDNASDSHTETKKKRRKKAERHHLPPAANNATKNEARAKWNVNAVEEVDRIKASKNETESRANSPRVPRTLHNMETAPSHSNCPAGLQPTDISTTLIVQSSLDRMWILQETCSRWKDPIIAVVYMFDDEARNEVWKEPTDWETVCPQLTVIPYGRAGEEGKQGYPVNTLRNIGLDAANTSHILVVDVDFVPSMDLHKTIRETLKERQIQMKQKQSVLARDAVVVPAFERMPPEPCETSSDCGAYLKANSTFIPQTLDGLLSCVSRKECFVFQQHVNWEGHFSTHSASWLKGDWYDDPNQKNLSETGKRIKTVKCFDSLRYEPYVVLRWCPASSHSPLMPVAPYYDERFYGYGKNKIQLISHLRFMGYSFAILPRGFIVHNPHPESDVKKVWNNVAEFDLHDKMDKLYPKFLKELVQKYRNTTNTIVEPCERTHKKKK